MTWIWLLLIIPVMTAGLSWIARNQIWSERIHLFGSFITFATGIKVSVHVFLHGPLYGTGEFMYVDAFGAYLIVMIVMVGLTASLYSVGYMRYELKEGVITNKQLFRYYLWFHLFIFSMLLVGVINNIGFLWIAIELTTLVSALLVAFYQKGTSLEAAWKYLIIASVGIAFGLFGVILLYASGVDRLGTEHGALDWTVLQSVAAELNPQWMSIAFIFILVGFGTKAGLAPLHFWLPDAHSQAPSPVSAVLSGVLLNTALYGILRIYMIANETLDGEISRWLLGFGILSVAFTVPFILVQHDFKRMLAYSSVEHIGIIMFGVGIGGTLGLYGAMLHMFNHSMTKTMLFLAAGNINQKFHSKRIDRISGVIKVMPITGTAFLLGIFAIAGTPPFNIFISEFTIMVAGFKENEILYSVLFLSLIVMIFAGMVYYAGKMVLGRTKARVEHGEVSRWSTAALFIPLLFVVIFGIYIPPFMDHTLLKVVSIFQGGR